MLRQRGRVLRFRPLEDRSPLEWNARISVSSAISELCLADEREDQYVTVVVRSPMLLSRPSKFRLRLYPLRSAASTYARRRLSLKWRTNRTPMVACMYWMTVQVGVRGSSS